MCIRDSGKAMLAHLAPDALEAALLRQSFHSFTSATLDSPARLLAELEAIRRDGHALDRQEHEPGIICCAAPILSRGGAVLGAVSVTTTCERQDLPGLQALAPRIRRAADEIAAAAADWRFPETG